MVQAYVIPLRAVTEATRPVAPAVTAAAVEMVGVCGAEAAATVTVALAVGLEAPAALISTQVMVRVWSVDGAVYAIWLTPPLVTPADPPALVIVPADKLHEYVIPDRAETCAEFPVDPAGTGLAAVIAGLAGTAATFTVFEAAGLEVPAAFVSVQVRVIVPTAPAVNAIELLVPEVTPAAPPALVIVPPAMVHA
jgi:hypothetical protein